MDQGPYIAIMAKLTEIAYHAGENAKSAPSQTSAMTWAAHQHNVKDVMEMIARESARIEAENFKLAAGICEYRSGNEHGNPLCLKTNSPI